MLGIYFIVFCFTVPGLTFGPLDSAEKLFYKYVAVEFLLCNSENSRNLREGHFKTWANITKTICRASGGKCENVFCNLGEVTLKRSLIVNPYIEA